MGRRSKHSAEQKIEAVRQYLSGNRSSSQLCHEYSVYKNTIHTWLSIYKRDGPDGLIASKSNATYTKEFKLGIVQAYLSGEDSYMGLAIKYRIPSHFTIRDWVNRYNDHKDLKDYDPKGSVYMTPNRKTTLEERIGIVKYCLEHDRTYKLAAERFEVAYAQVYQWVKKYEESGEPGLMDRRGKHKTEEQLSELEKLQRENERLRRQLELKERESILLKKVKEFERRQYSPKPNKNHNT